LQAEEAPPPPQIEETVEVKEAPITLSVPKEVDAIKERSWLKITLVTVAILASLGFILMAGIGTFGIMGAHASFAPQFMVSISHVLGSPFVSYGLTAVGTGAGLISLGLVAFAIYSITHKKNHRDHRLGA